MNSMENRVKDLIEVYEILGETIVVVASSTNGDFLVWAEKKEGQQEVFEVRSFSSENEARVHADALVNLFQEQGFRLLTKGIFISQITRSDKPAFIEHFKDKEISDHMVGIAYPYADKDADEWINWTIQETEAVGRPINFAIRRPDGYLIGGIGFHAYNLDEPHRAELGYWLAKAYWNKGIMTEALNAISTYAFNDLGLVRLTAPVFHFNTASARALEKSGFTLEAHLRNYYHKDGKVFDGKLYSKIPKHKTAS